MWRLIVMAASLTLTVACSATTAPVPGELSGTWGAADIQLVASATTVTLGLACQTDTFDGPIQVDATGRFAAMGVVTRRAINDTPLTHVHLSGTIHGSNVAITYYDGDPATPPGTSSTLLTPNGYYPTFGCAVHA
jgi:hypothetical protein